MTYTSCYVGSPIKFELCIKGLGVQDEPFATGVFIGIWNQMARLSKSSGITEAYQNVFDTYFPTENRVNENCDNAYVYLYEKLTKELCDKLSPMMGKLPSGKTVYVAQEEPITFNPDIGKGWLKGYVM